MAGHVEYRGAEFRAPDSDGRAISGVVIPYGQWANIGNRFRERFLPGSITFGDVIANVQHNRHRPIARTDGGGLSVIDSGNELRAKIELPDTVDGNDVLTLVRGKILRGFSAEFRVLKDTWQARERTIHSAELRGLAVVDSGAYAAATVDELRALEELSGAGVRRIVRYF